MSAKNILGVFLCLFALALPACRPRTVRQPVTPAQGPARILWVWERPEDLRFLDANRYGAAFIAQTLFLRGGDVVFRPRRQPFQVNPDVYLIAVTRIETDRTDRPELSDAQREKIIDFVRQSLSRPHVKAVQIDFDATVSERDFYRTMMHDLRRQLPAAVPLTMTALASWCVGESWLNEMPVDEAVPMAFRMGADDRPIRDFLANGGDWREPLCRASYGIALDEPLTMTFKPERRIFIFKNEAWKPEDLSRLP